MSSKLSALTDLAGGQVPTDLVYVDQVSAGASGSKKSTLNDFIEQITKNITDAVLKGLNGAGTNGPGGNFDLSGGRATGNAVPGFVSLRYPLVGASGSTLQSLSSSRFPIVANMFTGGSKTIVNTVTETTLFGTGSAGSTLTIEAGMARVGEIYRVTIPVFFTTTGTPTVTIKIKLGSSIIANSTAITFAVAGMQSRGYIIGDLAVTAIGATGAAQCEPLAFWFGAGASVGADNPLRLISAGGSQTIDFTAAQVIDVTWQWGTASLSNSITALSSSIEIIR